MAQNQIMEAVEMTGHENGHPGHIIGKVQSPFHFKLSGKRLKCRRNFLAAKRKTFEFPLNPHKEYFPSLGGILVGMNYIAVILKDKIG